jgi:hypothetical protein
MVTSLANLRRESLALFNRIKGIDGRPVRARTADLHRVNCVVRKLNPFACLAFPVLTGPTRA